MHKWLWLDIGHANWLDPNTEVSPKYGNLSGREANETWIQLGCWAGHQEASRIVAASREPVWLLSNLRAMLLAMGLSLLSQPHFPVPKIQEPLTCNKSSNSTAGLRLAKVFWFSVSHSQRAVAMPQASPESPRDSQPSAPLTVCLHHIPRWWDEWRSSNLLSASPGTHAYIFLRPAWTKPFASHFLILYIWEHQRENVRMKIFVVYILACIISNPHIRCSWTTNF